MYHMFLPLHFYHSQSQKYLTQMMVLENSTRTYNDFLIRTTVLAYVKSHEYKSNMTFWYLQYIPVYNWLEVPKTNL